MRLPIDLLASLLMALVCIVVVVAHRMAGAPNRYRRVMQQGGTFFLDLNLMHAGYWMLQPVVRACARHGISATAVTWLSLLPATAAAAFAATGHWGFAAWCLLAAALMDVMDGAVARETQVASAAGAVLDSVLDRYAEFLFFAGVFVYYRNNLAAQLIVLVALVGSFLVTYSTAKAEALHITPPRGSMKRSDRLALMVLGTAATPFSRYWFESPGTHPGWPLLIALSLIAVLANVSAIHRFIAIAHEAHLRSLEGEPPAPNGSNGAAKPGSVAAPRPASVAHLGGAAPAASLRRSGPEATPGAAA